MAKRAHKDFTKVGALGKHETVRYTHKVDKVRKKPKDDKDIDISAKYQHLWYMKTAKSLPIARREVLAQEFFRLLNPSQPKTRLIIDEEGKAFVISKQVEGFSPIIVNNPLEIKIKYKEGKYKGLGEILVASLLLSESDLKYGNVGLDKNKNVVKLDGDWCFARFRYGDKYRFEIASNAIDFLPFPTKEYQPHNWLDVIEQRLRKNTFTKITTVDQGLSSNPNFRAEVNFALLKIMILPPRLIENFVKTYITDPQEAEILYNEIIDRRLSLRTSALNNVSFRKYLQTELAREQLDEYKEYLKDFKTTGKDHIYDETYSDEIEAAWNELQPLEVNIRAQPTSTLDEDIKGKGKEKEQALTKSSEESEESSIQIKPERKNVYSTDDFTQGIQESSSSSNQATDRTYQGSSTKGSTNSTLSTQNQLTLDHLAKALKAYRANKNQFFGIKWLTASKESSITIDRLNGTKRDKNGKAITKDIDDQERYNIAINFIKKYPEKDLAMFLCKALGITPEKRDEMIKNKESKKFNIK